MTFEGTEAIQPKHGYLAVLWTCVQASSKQWLNHARLKACEKVAKQQVACGKS